MPGADTRRFDDRPPRPGGRWLTLLWLVGTAAAVSLTVAAVQLAGSAVTGRPLPSVSSDHLQAALIDDALTLSRGQAGTPESASDATATTTGPGADAERAPAGDHPAAESTGAAAQPGGDHAPAPTATVPPDDQGAGPVPTTEMSPTHPTTTTTMPTAGVTYSKGFTGGTVSVHCTGNRITLLSASPSAGFTKAVSDSGPEEVEVHFTSSSRETEIHAQCTNDVVSWQG